MTDAEGTIRLYVTIPNCEDPAAELKVLEQAVREQLTGYQRLMVRRFDAKWNPDAVVLDDVDSELETDFAGRV